MIEIDERYAAGFFDGEGCVHLNRNLRAILAGCFRSGLLEAFCEKWGGRVTTYLPKSPKRRAIRRWEVTGPKAERFLNSILPFLIEKQSRAVLGIRYQETKRRLNIRGGKGYSDEQRRIFSEMETELKIIRRPIHCYL